jgi:hypothetical protein
VQPTGLLTVSGNGWVGRCFFDAHPVVTGGLAQCAEFGFRVHRTAANAVTSTITLVCDKGTGDVKFTAKSISDLVINGNSASFLATGVILATPANTPATATIAVTDNGGIGADHFATTLKAGTKLLCNASNSVKGIAQVLVGKAKPRVTTAANRVAAEQLISTTPPKSSRAAWPLLLTLALALGAFAFGKRHGIAKRRA